MKRLIIYSIIFIAAFLISQRLYKVLYEQKDINPSIDVLAVYHQPAKWYKMIGTTYNPEKGQTDNSPYETANKTKINKLNPISSRLVGLPRWMLKSFNNNAPFKYKDTIIVISFDTNFPYQGYWIVADNTTARNYNCVDFCVSRKDSMNVFKDIYITKFSK